MVLEKKGKRKSEQAPEEAPAEVSPKKKSKKKKNKERTEPVEEIVAVEPPAPAKPAATPSKSPAIPKNKKAEKRKVVPATNNEPHEESDVEKEEVKETNGEANLPEWSKEEYLELFSRIQDCLPKDDLMKYESRVNHLDWSKVSFDGHSADDCKNRWLYVQNRLRRFRILSELIADAREWSSHPWFDFRRGAKSQNKHPDLPKKPLSSYMLFFMDVRDKVSSENPHLDMPQLSKHIGQLFNSLSEKKKQKYIEKAKEEKLAYEKRMDKFCKEHPDVAPQKPEKAPAKVKLPQAPLGPLRLYTHHKIEKALKGGNANKTEITEQCRAKWKTLSEESKLKWINKALELEADYKEEIEAFKEANPSVEVPPFKGVLNKEEQALKAKSEGKPEKPPNSGYSLFSKELLGSEALRHLESKDRMTEISRMWRDLPETERNQYNETARQLIHDYKLEFASYLDTLPADERGAALKAAQPKSGQKHSKEKEESEKEKEKSASKKANNEEPAKKKQKTKQAVPEPKPKVEEEESEEESDREEQVKPAPEKQITKPNSPLEMFCQVNSKKYQAKHPEATDQERLRLMAKAYNKLGKAQKEKYVQMAKEHQETAIKTTPKAAAPSKKTAAAPAAKKETPKVDTKTRKATSPVKSSNSEGLFRNEPPKPAATVEELYADTICKQKKIDREQALKKWETLSTSQQDKYNRQYNRLRDEYLKAFEEFLRGLTPTEVIEYKSVIAKRTPGSAEAANDESEADESDEDDEEDEDEESEQESDEESDDSD